MCLFLGNGVASIYSTFHITVIQIDSVIFMVLEVEPRTSYILNKYSITILYTQTNFHLLFWDRASLSFLVLVMNSLCIPDCSWFSCLCFWSNWDFRIVLPGFVWDSLFIYIYLLHFMYMHVSSACMCVHWGPLELKLLMVLSHHVSAGNWAWLLCKNNSWSICWATVPVLVIVFLSTTFYIHKKPKIMNALSCHALFVSYNMEHFSQHFCFSGYWHFHRI